MSRRLPWALAILAFSVHCQRQPTAKVETPPPPVAAASTGEADRPPAATAEIPGGSRPADGGLASAQVSIDDIAMGPAITPDRSIPERVRFSEFAPGQLFYVSMRVTGTLPGTTVNLRWYGPEGNMIREDEKRVAADEPRLAFMMMSSDKWPKGDYRVEIWVGEQRVASLAFRIGQEAKWI